MWASLLLYAFIYTLGLDICLGSAVSGSGNAIGAENDPGPLVSTRKYVNATPIGGVVLLRTLSVMIMLSSNDHRITKAGLNDMLTSFLMHLGATEKRFPWSVSFLRLSEVKPMHMWI